MMMCYDDAVRFAFQETLRRWTSRNFLPPAVMSPFADDAISCSLTDLAVSLIKRVVARASDARRSSMMFFEDDDDASPLATAFSVSSRVKSFNYVE